MKILSVRTENILRCQLAEVSFENDVVVLGGMNGEGKTSFANSIWMAFGGKDAIPEQPVTEGADIGTIDIELDGDFLLTRKVYPNRETVLELRDKAGGKYKRPQELLDSFNLRFSFWPQDFIMMKEEKQQELLRTMLGLDFAAVDRKIEALTEKRRDIGREQKQLEGQLAGMPEYETLGFVGVSIAALSQQLSEAHTLNQNIESEKRRAGEHRKKAEGAREEIKRARAEIERLEDLILDAESRVEGFDKEAQAIEEVCNSTVPLDVTEIEAQINEAEKTNAKIQLNNDKEKVRAQANEKKIAYEEMTARIRAEEGAKEKALAEAKFPVAGLGFGEKGITFQNKPFKQASTAQQWEVAIGIGFRMNPEIKLVYIQYGPLIDERIMGRIMQMVKEEGGQLLLEMAGLNGEFTVVFENGVAHPVEAK